VSGGGLVFCRVTSTGSGHEHDDPEEAMMARAPWNRPGESAATRRLRIAMFFSAVVLVVAVIAILVYFVVRSAGIAGL